MPVSDETLSKVSAYISLTRELTIEEFQIWKLFERTNKALNSIFREGKPYNDDEQKLWISLDVSEKKLPELVKQLIAIG